jgi:hypothetical protein
MQSPAPIFRSDLPGVDRNAPVTIPAWLFQQLIDRPQPRPNPLIDPFDILADRRPITDFDGITPSQYQTADLRPPPPLRTSPTESGGGVPNPFRQWEPVGRNTRPSAADESGIMDDTSGGD